MIVSGDFCFYRNDEVIDSKLPEWATVSKEDVLFPKDDGEDKTRDYKIYTTEKTWLNALFGSSRTSILMLRSPCRF